MSPQESYFNGFYTTLGVLAAVCTIATVIDVSQKIIIHMSNSN